MEKGLGLYAVAVTVALIMVSIYATAIKPKEEKVTVYKQVMKPLPVEPTQAQVMRIIENIPRVRSYAKPGCVVERGPDDVNTRIGCHDGNLNNGQFTWLFVVVIPDQVSGDVAG